MRNDEDYYQGLTTATGYRYSSGVKKAILLLIFALGAVCFATGDGFSFVFDRIETNPEFLYDFFPTYYKLGVNYRGFQMIPGNSTELILLGSGGYGHTKLWTDESGIPFVPGSIDTGTENFRDLQSYNNVLLGADLRLQQSLNPALVTAPGNLAVYAQYALSWMHPLENGGGSYGLDGTQSAYPDKTGALWNELSIGVFLDTLIKEAVRRGYRGEVSAALAPGFLVNSGLGNTNYAVMTGSFVSYIPIYSKSRDNGLHLFGLYLADRVAANYALGDSLPQRVQYPIALGTMMRGIEKNAYGTAFTAVNNFEVRIAGPELFLKKLYPRFHVFLDIGAYTGNYLNTSYPGGGFLASAGFELAFSVFDFFSPGYRGAFVLSGENIADVPYTGGIMLNLQF